MHSLILCLKSKDVLWALRPRLAIVRIDVGHDMGHTFLVVGNSLRVGIEVSSAIVLSIEILVVLQSIVAMKRYNELDAVSLGVVHKVIQSVQDGIVEWSW